MHINGEVDWGRVMRGGAEKRVGRKNCIQDVRKKGERKERREREREGEGEREKGRTEGKRKETKEGRKKKDSILSSIYKD